MKIGTFKLPFLREELTDSRNQTAVERSSTAELFTLDRADQIQLQWDAADNVAVLLSFSDGTQSTQTLPGGDQVEIAVTARVDVAIAGDLKQIEDFAAWSGEPFGAFVGGAIHYQTGDGYNPGGAGGALYASSDYFVWTIDGSIETNGLNVFASISGADASNSGIPAVDSINPLGFVIQGGYMVIPDKLEPFIRYEYIDSDDASLSDDDASLLTIGVNYYFEKSHDAKLTVDLVFLLDGDDLGNMNNPGGSAATGQGFGGDDLDNVGFSESIVDEGTVVLRIQFQLLF